MCSMCHCNLCSCSSMGWLKVVCGLVTTVLGLLLIWPRGLFTFNILLFNGILIWFKDDFLGFKGRH